MNGYRLRFATAAAVAAMTLLSVPRAAHAYGGPGSVVSGIGALLAAVAAVGAAVVGFFWFPLKRLIRNLRGRSDDAEGETAQVT